MTKQAFPAFKISGGGVTGELFRSIDWDKHPLGPPEHWPSVLKTTLNIMFHSQHPMFVWWGPELYQFYNDGYLPSFGVGKHPHAMGQRGEECWPEIWPIIGPQIDLVMSGKGSTWNENQLVPIFRNGRIEDVYWTYGYSPIIHDDGTVGGTLVVCTETTAQILATKSLAESEARLNLALTAGDIGFWDWNGVTGHVLLSQTLMDDWGIDPKTFGNTLPECLGRIHPADRDRVWAAIRLSAYGFKSYDVEYRVIRPSGEEIIVNAKGKFFLDDKGQPLRLTGITLNITARKRAEEALERAKAAAEEAAKGVKIAKEEAERANQLKSDFLANMSHEIRTPLGAMLGFADLLRDPGLPPSDHQNFIDIICRNGENLSAIINDILDLSKVEAGFLAMEYTRVKPELVAGDVRNLLEVKARDKSLVLSYECDPSTPEYIVSDANRVRQILLNLAGNSLKFTQVGKVVIRSFGMKNEEGREILCFEVMDTGIGLDDFQKEKIFERFVQADRAETRRFGGTGIGLPLSRSLARLLGGNVVVVDSAPGKGSTFLFTVASQAEKFVMESPIPKIPSPASEKSQPTKGTSILVVDDSPDNQNLLRRVLTREGAIVEVAENGILGYHKALAGDFDIVLMDIQMPEMDGYTATYNLRAIGYKKPIIALTAHAMTEIREKCLDVGYTDHLSKPINIQKLLEAISKYSPSKPTK